MNSSLQRTEKTPTMNTFLHVGCGRLTKERATAGFNTPDWREIRLDIDPDVAPDIIGSLTDMSAVGTASMDAIYSSHNIEHLYPHEVPQALAEFRRVLKDGGFAVITCPDLQSVAALIAEDKLTEPAYTSPAGPITPLDILFGLRTAVEAGNHYMAHRCGFTLSVLFTALKEAGFKTIGGIRREGAPHDLWVIASTAMLDADDLNRIALDHFPVAVAAA